MGESELGLADAVGLIRSELKKAQDEGAAEDVRFAVGKVEVALAVEVAKTGGGEASIKVLNIFSLGASGEVSKGETNTITIELMPQSVNGKPFEVAAAGNRRPDRRSED